MGNDVFFKTSSLITAGVPNISISKAMLVDRALVSGSQPGGREIKLKYNIFTNIMTLMLSRLV